MNVAGVNMGNKASMVGRIFALPASLIKGIGIAAKNIFDTLNPLHVHNFGNNNKFSEMVVQMLQALDAMSIESAGNKLSEFIHVLGNGGDSSYIDRDARYVS